MRCRFFLSCLLFLLLFFSCSSPYLFVSDEAFSELEQREIQQSLSSALVYETFKQAPSPGQVLELAADKRAGALIFSPLYHDLARKIVQQGADIPVYAVGPSGFKGKDGLRSMELDSRGAADPVLDLIVRYLPEENPAFVTLIAFSEDTPWSGLMQKLEGTKERVRLKAIHVTAEMLKTREINQFIRPRTDVMLILLGDYTQEIVKKIGRDSRESLPKLVIGDRFMDSGGNFRSYTLTVDWSGIYKALINGTEQHNPWLLVPNSSNE
jgi:hypothetical protein